MSIYSGEIDERFQRRAATARAHCAVDLVCRIIVRTSQRSNRAGLVVENNHRRLRDVVTIQCCKMGADKSFSCSLQIEIERCPDRAAQRRIPRNYGIDKMLRQMRWIKPARNGRRFRQKSLLFASDHAQLRQTRERALVFSSRKFGMSPRVESSWGLRQTRDENRFGHREVAG